MTIMRIAKLANVPYATAWRILNNLPCDSEEAVATVQKVVRETGYVPGSGRRGRPSKAAGGVRSHNIALLHLRPGTGISVSILSSVQALLAERNLNLLFAEVKTAADLPQAIRAGNIDGILGYGEIPEDAATASLKRIPAVWLMSRLGNTPDPWGDRVKPDHTAIGELAANHLVQRGHDRVAYFNPVVGFAMYDERCECFRRAAEFKGRSVSVLQGFNTKPAEEEDVYLAAAATLCVEQWLALPVRPTGLFCPIDRLTLRVHQALQRKGIEPGRDVELVSCDNQTDLLSLMDPRPVSIDLNRKTVARLAVERLLWRMRNGMSSPSVVINVCPSLGTSTADAAGRNLSSPVSATD